ncbi:uncharacterized protein LOC110700883 [Chenopodium quinoa]|uniref:Large ribosomal subunit protein uL6 alpha-beta domain-containing protein n=1 Tax=Chenopodium quinoa TaxID=63459 RepID=A0A803L8T5_CHEQI|nr:uncharacterized protein LOC110700883 [Chenopodium quinoa]
MEARYFRILRLLGKGNRARAEADGRLLRLKLGYSHEVELPVPPAVRVFCFKPDKICCVGIDKARTLQFAATVRSVKPHDTYNEIGIRYNDEVVKMKPGKKGRLKKKGYIF